MAFIFGGNSGMSYEQLQRQREVAAALAARGPGAPRNIGEGLAAVGNALAVRGMTKRADAEEARMRGELDNTWAKAVGANPGGGNMPTGTRMRSPEPMTEGEAVADDAMATLIKLGLTERGLPEHVADGFVMNAADESGFRTDINEINPLVPGSRGGFGLMQWTGPRRVALEREAQGRGVDPSDLNLQLDTIVKEMIGPEARAGQSILSTKDAPSAAQAIVANYLRPAPENLARRSAEYGAGGGYDIAALAEVAGNPMASPGQRMVAETLLARAFEQPDPMAAIELEKAQLELEALRNPQSQPEYRTVGDSLLRVEGNTVTPVFEAQSGPDTVVQVGGEGDAFYKELDKGQATMFQTLMNDGVQASRTSALLDNMAQTLERVPTGGTAAFKAALGEWGISTEGLDDIQAVQALINQIVPQQRQPGSGPMSDADLALFKQSVPRIINQPGGNKIIVDRMRAINAYTAQQAEIAARVANREITPAQGREALQGLSNPLAGIKEQVSPPAEEMTFEAFKADPSAQAAADRYGVTLEEMWEIKKGLQ